MAKKIAVVLMAVVFLASFGMASHAMEGCSMGGGDHQHAQASEISATDNAVNVGNTTCPVLGGKVDNKTKYEYKGKVYNFCCPGCIDEFKKNPEKYIKKIEDEKL